MEADFAKHWPLTVSMRLILLQLTVESSTAHPGSADVQIHAPLIHTHTHRPRNPPSLPHKRLYAKHVSGLQ